MEKKIRIFLMSGTHWDREWYKSFQGFRYRLVEMMDDLLEKLERFPEMDFVFDGRPSSWRTIWRSPPKTGNGWKNTFRTGAFSSARGMTCRTSSSCPVRA